MNNKAHLRPKDYDSNGDIIPDSVREDKGDLISREALKKALNEMFDTFEVVLFDDIIATIDNAPTVETFTKDDMAGAYNEGYACGSRENKRPKGEWIVLVDADNIQTCKCSLCGRMVDIANREFDKFPYCHCGAKMRGDNK